MTTLSDKTVLITGGGAGLGRAMVEAFMAEGAHVVAMDRNAQALLTLPAALGQTGGTCTTCALDVRDENAVAAYLNALPTLDVLVNNAGIARKRPFLETSTQELRDIFELNVIAAFTVMREAARKMVDTGGHIINIASDAALLANVNMAPYVASKHALLGLGRTLSLELRKHGVRVTSFCPGSMATEIFGPGTASPLAMSPTAVAEFVVQIARLPPELEVREVLLEPMTLVEERFLRELGSKSSL